MKYIRHAGPVVLMSIFALFLLLSSLGDTKDEALPRTLEYFSLLENRFFRHEDAPHSRH